MDSRKVEKIEKKIREDYPWLAKALMSMVTLVGKVLGLANYLWKKLTKR